MLKKYLSAIFVFIFTIYSFSLASRPKYNFDDGAGSSFPLPPLELEWDFNPSIFSVFPKVSSSNEISKLKLDATNIGQKYLPRTTKPKEYWLELRIILESEIDGKDLAAPGKVRILTKCVEATNEIVLHVRKNDLKIIEDSVKVTAKSGSGEGEIKVLDHIYDQPNDFYIIQLASECQVNREYFIDIDFIADIVDDRLTGLYLSTYTDPVTNITKRLATTQFEAEFARQMFPHYDDPDYKAIFHITVGRFETYNSLSNMNIIKTEPIPDLPGWFWDHYAPTPVMSSYLIAVIVSDFTCVSAAPPGYKKHVEICAPPYMIERGGGDHSAEVVATILDFYDGFMKQPYPLPKMTSVAIPDFEAGAMENWGLNTYRIKGLIYYPNITSEEERLKIELTIAHELAHQNWGNLVTCKFWNQIWLNEGFATYISYYGLKSVSPEYDPEKQWLSYRKRALLSDASITTHPLVNVSNQMYYFDGISYSKGASLLRMMEKFLTEKVFHAGLQFYLSQHAYDTATQWDLFEILDLRASEAGVNPSVGSVAEIMETWSLQRGYPLIRVEYITNRVISITQERFIDDQSIAEEDAISENSIMPTFWYIPITLQHDKITPNVKEIPYTWLTNTEMTKVIYLEEKFEYIVVNPGASALTRVLYDEKSSQLIENVLLRSHEVLSAVTRAQILDDAFEGVWAGYTSVESALNLTRYLGQETEAVVWTTALNGLGRIYSMLVDDVEGLLLIKNYLYDRVGNFLTSLELEETINGKGMQVIHVGSMLFWAGLLEIPKALEHATNSVNKWVDSSINTIPADLHAQTYCNAIIGGNKAVYNTLLTFLKNETIENIQQGIAIGLACSKDKTILQQLRANITDKQFIATIPSFVNYEIMIKLARNSLTRETLIHYLDSNFDEIKHTFEGVGVFVRNLEAATQYWNTKEQLEKVESFIEKYANDFKKAKRRLKRVTDQIQKNILWVEHYSDAVKAWLRQENQP